jgi:hypothetical protein
MASVALLPSSAARPTIPALEPWRSEICALSGSRFQPGPAEYIPAARWTESGLVSACYDAMVGIFVWLTSGQQVASRALACDAFYDRTQHIRLSRHFSYDLEEPHYAEAEAECLVVPAPRGALPRPPASNDGKGSLQYSPTLNRWLDDDDCHTSRLAMACSRHRKGVEGSNLPQSNVKPHRHGWVSDVAGYDLSQVSCIWWSDLAGFGKTQLRPLRGTKGYNACIWVCLG